MWENQVQRLIQIGVDLLVNVTSHFRMKMLRGLGEIDDMNMLIKMQEAIQQGMFD